MGPNICSALVVSVFVGDLAWHLISIVCQLKCLRARGPVPALLWGGWHWRCNSMTEEGSKSGSRAKNMYLLTFLIYVVRTGVKFGGGGRIKGQEKKSSKYVGNF